VSEAHPQSAELTQAGTISRSSRPTI